MADYKEEWQIILQKRNNKLAASDWTQMPDSPLSTSKKAEWATYRQTLRNLPNTIRSHSNFVSEEKTNPDDGTCGAWVWPTKPN
tara:strand:- start:2028 stop:2279 length:252 start_codon:yes stop_codon:yes gene_type:complete